MFCYQLSKKPKIQFCYICAVFPSGETVVQINITDVNNKLPEFEVEEDTTRISENTSVGINFFNYQATDLDVNHKLRYSQYSCVIFCIKVV